MSINIPAGAFGGGSSFMDIAAPIFAKALAGITGGQKTLEQTEYERGQEAQLMDLRKQSFALQKQQADREDSLNKLAELVKLHGPDVVNHPEFGGIYQQLFGKPWPTTTATEEIPGTAKPGVPAVPGVPAAWGEPSIPGVVAQPAVPAQTKQVTKPSPLGGIQMWNPSLAELGVQGPLGKLSLQEARAAGFDIDNLFKAALSRPNMTKADVEGQALAKFMQVGWEGLNPAERIVIQSSLGEKDPTTPEGFVTQHLVRVNGDITKLAPWEQSLLDKHAQGVKQQNVIEQVRQLIKDKGEEWVAKNDPGAWAIWTEEIRKTPSKYTLEDYKQDILTGKIPVPTDPTARQLLGLDKGAAVDIRQLRIKYLAAEGELNKAYSAMDQMRKDKAWEGTMEQRKAWDESVKKIEGIRKNRDLYKTELDQMLEDQKTAQQPTVANPPRGVQTDAPPMTWANSQLQAAPTELAKLGLPVTKEGLTKWVNLAYANPRLRASVPAEYWQALRTAIAALK